MYTIFKNNGEALPLINMSNVITFLTAFGNMNFEKIYDDIPDRFRDSLLAIGPFNSIYVRLVSGEEKTVDLYRKKFTGETMNPDDEGVKRQYDPDRFYLFVHGEKTWYFCQYLQWNRLLKTPSYFMPPRNRK